MSISKRVFSSQAKGFTIVELLIVIVVIAILAVITIIAYNGVTQQAFDTSMKVDGENSAKVLSDDYETNGAFPATAGAANGGRGLPSSNGDIDSYTVNNGTNPPTYSLTISNAGSPHSYIVTSANDVPTLVTATLPVITYPGSGVVINDNFEVNDEIPYINSVGTGSPTPTIQWQMLPKNTTTGTWTNVLGVNSSVAMLTTNFYPSSSGQPYYTDGDPYYGDGDYGLFRVVYTNSAGSMTSPSVKVNWSSGGG